jgi:signal transduction histidine kinase
MKRRMYSKQAGSGPVGEEKRDTPEQEMARLTQELAFVQKKLQIVGSVTRHDIVNQMTAIMGVNEILLTMVEDEKLRSFLEIERRATEKIRRILAYSKVFQNIGAEPPRWQRLDAVLHLAGEEISLGAVSVRFDQKGCSILADPQFFKVFVYLFDNSIRHGQTATQIRLQIRQAREGPVLIIEDNGAGIPPEEKERVFERGYGKQTGWGLYVAREILSATGMTIRETGTAGSGARFEITIPPERIRIGETPPAV